MSSDTITVQKTTYVDRFGDRSQLMIFKCEDLWYGPKDNEKYFVLCKSNSYGYFKDMKKKYTAGEILDEFKVRVTI